MWFGGLNGDSYDMCPNENLEGPDCYRGQSKKPFSPDPLFYHRPLFGEGEEFKVVHTTDKAILFSTEEGDFWVPKALMGKRILTGTIMVHKSFSRTFI